MPPRKLVHCPRTRLSAPTKKTENNLSSIPSLPQELPPAAASSLLLPLLASLPSFSTNRRPCLRPTPLRSASARRLLPCVYRRPSSLCSRPRSPPHRAATAAGLLPFPLPVTTNGGVRGQRGQFVDQLAQSATWTATAPVLPVISFRFYKRPVLTCRTAGITRQLRGSGGAQVSRFLYQRASQRSNQQLLSSGESMDNALRACCKDIKIMKILIHREGDEGQQLICHNLPKEGFCPAGIYFLLLFSVIGRLSHGLLVLDAETFRMAAHSLLAGCLAPTSLVGLEMM